MDSYAGRECFGSGRWVLDAATAMVERLPGHLDMEGREIRCHELARAVCRVLSRQSGGRRHMEPYGLSTEFLVIDGMYGPASHSWIEFIYHPQATQSKRRAILDVYTVGRLPQVQLVDMIPVLEPTWSMYKQGTMREDIRQDVVDLILWSTGNAAAMKRQRTGERS